MTRQIALVAMCSAAIGAGSLVLGQQLLSTTAAIAQVAIPPAGSPYSIVTQMGSGFLWLLDAKGRLFACASETLPNPPQCSQPLQLP
jgi:hypothetical protein